MGSVSRTLDWLDRGKRIFPAALLLFVAWPVAAALPPAKPIPVSEREVPKIRVRLIEATPTLALRGFDLTVESERGRGRGLPAKRTAGLTQWSVRCQDGRVQLREQSGSGLPVDLNAPVAIGTPGGFLTLQGKPLRDNLVIYSVGSFCEAVNHLDLEKYLAGLVNAEFNSRWNPHAIAAQVIAARSYALFRMRESQDEHFDVDSTEKDQVYPGAASEDVRASRIVDQTRGIVMVAKENPREVVKAFYHSTCGGGTESPEAVWGGSFAGIHRGVKCGFCNGSPAFQWRVGMSTKELLTTLLRGAASARKQGGLIPKAWAGVALEDLLRQGTLVALNTSASEWSARVRNVTLDVSTPLRKQSLTLSSARFREWIGASRIKSTLFDLSLRGDAVAIQGRGNGHGVGMCQYGAKGMGDRGYTMNAILAHYYPDTLLKKFW